MTKNRIAIITPILAFRAGIASLLSPSDEGDNSLDGLEVVYQDASLEDFISDHPDTDLLVITGDAYSDQELLQLEDEYGGHLAFLVLSDDPRTASHLTELSMSTWGLLPVDSSREALHAAISALNKGLMVAAPELLTGVFTHPLRAWNAEHNSTIEDLTEREGEVLDHLARGLANKQIALALGISEHTVKFHISSIYSKLGVNNRAEAVRLGIQRGFVTM